MRECKIFLNITSVFGTKSLKLLNIIFNFNIIKVFAKRVITV